MKLLTLDCEFNQPSGKTIEIGAAAFEARTGVISATFQTYVNPGEPISQEITDLTGITDEKVNGAPEIAEAFMMLQAFHTKHGCFKNPVLWGSGVRNDSQHLWEESGSPETNFMGFRVTDAKTVYQSLQMIRNKSVRSGLEKSMNELGLEFVGKPHRALDDAINTATIWHYLMRRLSFGFRMEEEAKKI